MVAPVHSKALVSWNKQNSHGAVLSSPASSELLYSSSTPLAKRKEEAAGQKPARALPLSLSLSHTHTYINVFIHTYYYSPHVLSKIGMMELAREIHERGWVSASLKVLVKV